MEYQIDDGQESKVDFKMSNLKPKICSWLHSTWTKVKAKIETIIKGWDKIGITRIFLLAF
jgi:hypothetical protein